MDAKNRNGIYRNDYHRRNRKANISMHSHSHGRNVPIYVAGAGDVHIDLPTFTRERLVELARLHWNTARTRREKDQKVIFKTTVERMCVDYLKHKHTDYDRLGARTYGKSHLLLFRTVTDAIAEAYPYLRKECDRQYKWREGHPSHKTIRVVKTVTQLQVEDINFYEEQKPDDPITEEEEIPAFFNQLSSLDQERFLYLPPFLKPDQIRARRFGDDANDRWWEWEEELGLTSDIGRPDPSNGLLNNFGHHLEFTDKPTKKRKAYGTNAKRR